MADGGFTWLRALWAYVDERLVGISKKLKRTLLLLRLTLVLLVFGMLAVLGSALVGLFWPQYFSYAYAIGTIFLIIPLILMTALVALPLRAKSLVRLIDKGYPGNAREIAIRMAARKMRDQSIETEELLVETAVNESRKVYERYKTRTQVLERADLTPQEPGNPPQ